MAAHILLPLLFLPSLSTQPECAGCSQEQKELIVELGYLMDEFIPDPEDLEGLFEAEDLEPPGPARRPFLRWAVFLLPTVGLKLQIPLTGALGRHVTWEVFFFFNIRR